ncbi:hypothetical protein SAMN05216548_106105 [Faunimonas pinastri]|uniref:Negative modulator of initiation of replication SeqA N-terminal domain-containing protein n=1 Tax=Faunimonas pinastri TaxID=1855383 RepID=A0A1H9HNV9_9HYPH|nr:hypothetical protein [Faunimonas pinastri]SEQ63978.1 hypothetical protein SAMN05216548_106105 [Faunimonas pinastri]
MSKKKNGRKGDGVASVVEIDIDVYKAIEGARQDFTESRNDILRRMLRLDGDAEAPTAATAPGRRAKSGGAIDGGWAKIDRHGRQILLPEGTEIRATYGGQTVTGRIGGGAWEVGGQRYNSPSRALIENVRGRNGETVNLNGWRHWEAKLPGEEIWKRLMEV